MPRCIWVNPLIEKLLAHWMLSRILIREPMRMWPKIDIIEPTAKLFLKLTVEPRFK
jgi:hypothetical protein